VAIITAVILLTGCDAIESMTPVQPAEQSGELLFADDFSVSPNGWGTLGRNGGEIAFDHQGMVISVNLPKYMYWTVNGEKFADTQIDVDAVLLEGPPNDNFGVICRFQDNDNFYGFLISHDGYYGIFKLVDGKMVMSSAEGNMAYSDSIRQGGVVNHIQAKCNGSILSLTVNDVLLAEIQDDSFSSGQFGLIAGAYDTPGVKVLFDNLVVTQP
jgi:hypothetical protein